MKKNKIIVLTLALVALISIAGCTPNDTGLNNDRNRNLSTQTRINNNRSTNDMGMNNDWNTRNMGLDNPNNMNNNMLRNNELNNGMNNGTNDGLNNGMVRPDTNNMSGSANTLAREIAALPEVDKASVVLSNDTAIVGIQLRGTTQGTMTNSLKSKVEKMVKDKSTNIKNVSVTTDPELYSRVKTMSTSIGDGTTLESLGEDIKDLIRRITPNSNMNNTVPR